MRREQESEPIGQIDEDSEDEEEESSQAAATRSYMKVSDEVRE